MYENTLDNLNKAKEKQYEEAYFDIACFNAQQAIEFLIKSILLEYHIPYEFSGNKGHDILYLTTIMTESIDIDFDKKEELFLIAATITSWEQKGRYYDGIKTKETTVKRVLNIYKSLDDAFILLQDNAKGNKPDDYEPEL